MSASSGLPKKWLPLFLKFLKHLKIQSKEVASNADGTGTALELWGSQRRFLDELSEGLECGQRVFYFLKSRQLGITTISLAIDLFFLAMFPGTRAALVVDDDRNRDSFRNIINLYIDSFPVGFFGGEFKIKKGGNNRYGVKFTNNSQLDFLVAGTKEKESFGDGGGYSFAHLTEVGRYGCPTALTSFRQALSENNPNRLYIYESRAAGPNHWKDMWDEAGVDVYTIRRVFIGWWSHPMQAIPRSDARWTAYGAMPPDQEERELIQQVLDIYGHQVTREQLAWYRWRASAKDTTLESMHAQQPWTEDQAFVNAGSSFFAQRLLQQDYARIEDPEGDVTLWAYRYIMPDSGDFFETQIEELGPDSSPDEWQLRVWEKPVTGAKYVIGMDPAFGRNDNKNNHAIGVFRCYADKLVQVAEYATDEDLTMHAAWVLAHLAGNYENCMINLEITGPGGIVMQQFESLRNSVRQNPSQLAMARERSLNNFIGAARWYLYQRPEKMGAGFVNNFKTGYESKRWAWNQLKNMHFSREILIQSRPLVEEMIGVRQDGSELGAVGRNNDDRVMAAALACYAFKEWRQKELVAANETYEEVTMRESGLQTEAGGVVGAIYRNYLKRVEREQEEAELDTSPKSWFEARGFS